MNCHTKLNLNIRKSFGRRSAFLLLALGVILLIRNGNAKEKKPVPYRYCSEKSIRYIVTEDTTKTDRRFIPSSPTWMNSSKSVYGQCLSSSTFIGRPFEAKRVVALREVITKAYWGSDIFSDEAYFSKDARERTDFIFLAAMDPSKNAHDTQTRKLYLEKCQKYMVANHLRALDAASDVYDLKSPQGYALRNEEVVNDPKTGLKGYLIRPKDPNPNGLAPIIAFAGTDLRDSLQDLKSDSIGGANQLASASAPLRDWLIRLKSEGYTDVFITGHSLGGGIAQGAAALIPNEAFSGNIHVVTFNALGGSTTVNQFKKRTPDEVISPITSREYQSQFAVNYCMSNDLVCKSTNHLGEVRLLPGSEGIATTLSHSIETIRSKVQGNASYLLGSEVISREPNTLAPAIMSTVNELSR